MAPTHQQLPLRPRRYTWEDLHDRSRRISYVRPQNSSKSSRGVRSAPTSPALGHPNKHFRISCNEHPESSFTRLIWWIRRAQCNVDSWSILRSFLGFWWYPFRWARLLVPTYTILASAHNINGVLHILSVLLLYRNFILEKMHWVNWRFQYPITDPSFLKDLPVLNRADVPFILTPLPAIIIVPDGRRHTISQPSNAKVLEQGLHIFLFWFINRPVPCRTIILSMLSRSIRNWHATYPFR